MTSFVNESEGVSITFLRKTTIEKLVKGTEGFWIYNSVST